MPYDLNGAAYDRREPEYPFWWALIFVALVVVLVASCAANTLQQTHDSLDGTLTADGSYIRWYVFTDPDTGIEYLVNDRGGCTPRLDSAGKPQLS